MLRLTLAVFCFLALALAVACGDDDDASGSPTLTPGARTTDAATPASTEPGEDDGDKTEGPTDVPGEETPGPTAPGDVPTAPPTASTGIPAVAPADQGAFAGQFQGQVSEQETCTYNPTTALVSCPSADYAIDPPIVGQDITCNVWIVSGVRELVQCTSLEPTQTTYYEIME